MHIGLHVEYSFFFSEFNQTSIFLDIFSKNTQISNFIKIRLVRVQLFHADEQSVTNTLFYITVCVLRQFLYVHLRLHSLTVFV